MRSLFICIALVCFSIACGDDEVDLTDAGGDLEHDAGAVPDASEPEDSGVDSGNEPDDVPMGPELATPEALEQIDSYQCGEAFDDCGGDPVGVWEMRPDYCVSAVRDRVFQGYPACSETITSYHLEGGGTIQFTAEGEVKVRQIYTALHHFNLNRACLEQEISGNDAEACSDYEATLNVRTGGETTTCVFQSFVCQCEFAVRTHVDIDLTYEVDGRSIVDEGGGVSPFCVQDDTLRIRLAQDGGNFTEATFDRGVSIAP